LCFQESFEQQMGRLQEEADSHRHKQEEMANVLGAERNAMESRMLEQQRETSQREAELTGELSAAKARVDELKDDIVRAERLYQTQRQVTTRAICGCLVIYRPFLRDCV
jgi:hypothetical protein